jgi:hypothetical protein
MSDQNTINEERARKFKEMGIPIPMAPIDPSSMKNLNADPDKLRKLEAIRNGAKKGEFKEILSKAEPKALFTPLPTPKSKQNPNAPKSEVVVPIKSFSPSTSADAEARLMESALFGEDPRTAAYAEPSQALMQNENRSTARAPRVLPEDVTNIGDDLHGTNFIQNFKARMASKGLSKPNGNPGIQVVQQPQLRQPAPLMSEAALEQKIMDIATVVATDIANTISKTMIKKVISEYAKDGSGIIIEGKNIRKAELVGNGVVKIGGKTYKLVPVVKD